MNNRENNNGNLAMNILLHQRPTAAQQTQRRENILIQNEAIINQIKNNPNTATTIHNLKIAPNVNGKLRLDTPQPLVKGETFEIDLSKIEFASHLSTQLGSESLNDLIQEQLKKHQIGASLTQKNRAQCTPITVALAGVHNENDASCQHFTEAEFVPVFHATTTQQERVLAICFSANGETGLRTDSMLLQGDAACLNRSTTTPNTTSAIKAIEMPRLFANNLQKQSPALFDELMKNILYVVFVKFSLIVIAELKGNSSNGPSGYSVTTQGSLVADNARTINECGVRLMTDLQVYIINPIVINTNGMSVNSNEYHANAVSEMKRRANELEAQYRYARTEKNPQFICDKPSTYSLNDALQKIFTNAGLPATHDMFGFYLLKMFNCNETLNGTYSEDRRHNNLMGTTHIYLGISPKAAKQLVNKINDTFKYSRVFASLEEKNVALDIEGEAKKNSCRIQIDTQLLVSEVFLQKLKMTIQQFPLDSSIKTQAQSTVSKQLCNQYSAKLNAIQASLISTTSVGNVKLANTDLMSSLSEFATILQHTDNFSDQDRSAVAAVVIQDIRDKMKLLKDAQTGAQHKLFKPTQKAIKEMLQECEQSPVFKIQQ